MLLWFYPVYSFSAVASTNSESSQADFSFATGKLEIPVVDLQDGRFFQVDLQWTGTDLYVFTLHNAFPITVPVLRPSTYFAETGKVHIPEVLVSGIGTNGSLYRYEVDMQFLFGTDPLQFQVTRAELTPPLSKTISIPLNGSEITAEVGIWMFKRRPNSVTPELDFNSIADWLGFPYGLKRLLEPINVIWVDYMSANRQEAKHNIINHLYANGFFPEGKHDIPSDIFEYFHSTGYFGLYISNRQHTPIWLPQYAPDDPDDRSDEYTWVDDQYPRENNHGRIFPAFPVNDSNNETIFITLGAFSRESACIVFLINCHNYLSFDQSRDKLQAINGSWEQLPGLLHIDNEYLPQLGLPFTTAIHSGVRVFVLYNDTESEENDNDNDGFTKDQGDCDDFNSSVNPDMDEIPYNNIDDDCDSATPDNSQMGCTGICKPYWFEPLEAWICPNGCLCDQNINPTQCGPVCPSYGPEVCGGEEKKQLVW